MACSTNIAWRHDMDDIFGTHRVSSEPNAIAIAPNGSFAYVAIWASNTVSVINTSTNMVVKTVTVDSAPLGVAIT